MAQLSLSLDTLGDLDGGAARAVVNAALRTATADLDDRGHDEKPREVLIKVTLRKIESGLVFCEVRANTKVPEFRTAETAGLVRREGNTSSILFQALAPDDPHQRTIDETGAFDAR